MSTPTEELIGLERDLYYSFVAILKSAKIGLGMEELKQLRLACKSLAITIKRETEAETIRVCRQIQTSIDTAIRKIALDIETLEQKIGDLNATSSNNNDRRKPGPAPKSN